MRVITGIRTTRSSRRRCSSSRRRGRAARASRRRRSSCTRPRSRPTRRGRHAHRHVRRAAPDAHRGADRRHLLRRRDQEVDLHRDERPAAARGRPPDALLGERRRRRRRRDLLRALRHGQDDALGRSRALADRRRRARLGRQRRLQHRGRLLREGDPALGGGRAGDLPDDAHLRDDPRERRRRRARRARPRRRLEDREHARRLQARADRERAAGRSRPAIRTRWSSSPPTPSGSCRRSRASRATRRSSTSSPASRRSSPARRSASPSRSRRSRPASARRSCRSRPPVYARMLGEKLDAHGATVWLVNTGWTGGPFGEGQRMPIAATRGLLHAALSGDARRGRVPHRRAVRLRGAGRGAGRRLEAPRPALDLERPGRVRREGARARRDVPGQLREVRRRPRAGTRGRAGRGRRAAG